jgi:hypothetical protein
MPVYFKHSDDVPLNNHSKAGLNSYYILKPDLNHQNKSIGSHQF